ncbi:MAG: glycoside hydrolase family 3 C-terminal domain-containing protein [Pontiellaceae bacterium]|nr:glycoside hydrolase family 3 C-terminal domain-containing protein [Pontiellaceae bacterium]
MSFRNIVSKISVALLAVAGVWLQSSTGYAAEEVCSSCSYQVNVAGEFSHERERGVDRIEGIGENAQFFSESIIGDSFTVTVLGLPEGQYSVVIGMAETQARAADERVFTVTSSGKTLAENYDIFADVGARKVKYIIGTVDHSDDALRGPLKVEFAASKGKAKFNTFEVINDAGARVVFFSATEIADPFSAEATKVPEIAAPAIWRNPDHPLEARIKDLISRMSFAEKVAQLQDDAPGIERLGLPAYRYWNEALHGVANNDIATVFPEPVGMGATWNPELLREEGRIIGVEGRAKHNDYTAKNNGNSTWWTGLTFWTPNLNVFRDPRWGRGQETYGEDPFLIGEIGVQFIQGMQGDDPKYMLSMACAKHYAVHSGPESSRYRFNAVPPERDLYEIYLPQFERAVREGKVAGVMSAYNAVNGVPASASKFLLTDLLRDAWDFEGYVVSDCSAIGNVWNAQRGHGYVDTPEEAAAVSVKAGCNLCCGGDYNALMKAAQQGLIDVAEIDQALYYTLWTRFRMGMFDPVDMVPFNKYTIEDNDTPENSAVALEIARQSLVLLKNDGILPLQRSKYKTIAVIGPNGASKSMLEGNYHGSASKPISILDGITALAGSDIKIVSAMGSPIRMDKRQAAWSAQDNTTDRPVEELRDEAVALAKTADLVIYVGGITAAQEGEGTDRNTIELPQVQQDLVEALYAVGKPMVFVNCSGSAVAFPWEAEHLPAILQAWYPGQNGGQAVAEVLFGEFNPTGHMPMTFYRSTEDLPDFEDYSFKGRTYRFFEGKPLYAFGHGLSYSEFHYKNAKLESTTIPADGVAKVSVTLENTGKMDGTDVVQVYYRHVNSREEQPKMVLCGFTRVAVESGKSETVTLEIPTERLRYWDTENDKYIVEACDYEFLVAAASDDIRAVLPATITE